MSNDQQEKFYEEENERQPETAVIEPRANEVDDMKLFIELLRHLRLAIETGKNVPLTSKKVIDAAHCLRIIDDLDKNLPDAVQYGLQMYSERDRIMGNAETAAMNKVASAEMRANATMDKAESEAQARIEDAKNHAQDIVADARERADKMVQDSEIMRQAREEARNMLNDARVEANEIRLKATHDAYKALTTVEDQLGAALDGVSRLRKEYSEEIE